MSETQAESSFRDQFREGIGLDDGATDQEPEAVETQDTEAVQQDATPAQPDRPRDPDTGQFVPAQAEPDVDPDVQAFIEHHGGGDPQKALAAAAAEQKERGRYQQELGQLRQMVQEVKQQTQPEYDPEEFEGYIIDDPRGAATQAYQHAQQTGDWRLYGQVIGQWKDMDPFAAADFHTDIKIAQQQAQWQQQQAPAQQLVHDQQMGLALQTAAQRHPELNDDQTIDALLDHPHVSYLINGPLREQITGGTPAQRQQALDTIVYTWRGLQGATAPQQQPAPAGNAQTAPTQGTLAQQARVATGSYSPARGTPDPNEKARDWFRRSVGLEET